jgi:hypothetical protein
MFIRSPFFGVPLLLLVLLQLFSAISQSAFSANPAYPQARTSVFARICYVFSFLFFSSLFLSAARFLEETKTSKNFRKIFKTSAGSFREVFGSFKI